jgi:hypothetical protein
MAIAVLVLALVAYGYLLIAFPEHRPIALGLGGAAAAAAAAYFWLGDPETRRAAPLIPPEQVEITEVAVTPTIRGVDMTGQVLNRTAAHPLAEVTIALTMRDCPPDAPPDEACAVAGESRAIARPDAPPGEARPLRASFIFRPAPTIAGEARYEWRLVEARAPR